MNRTQKEECVEQLTSQLQQAPFMVVANYRGVTVKEINQFRRTLEAAGLQYKVIKNTLARRAIAGSDREVLAPLLSGMNGWVISGEDPIAAAKVFRDAIKDFKKAEKFVVAGGFFEGGLISAPEVEKVADLPGREQLLGNLLATLQEAPRQVLGVIQGAPRDLLYLLKNFEAKLAEAAGEAE
jgi:large subunit ribosomal protein L10